MSVANVSVVKLADGREVCLSYGTIVAAFIPGEGFVRTAERFSVTSSKHATHFAGKDAPRIPHERLKTLCAPVDSRL